MMLVGAFLSLALPTPASDTHCWVTTRAITSGAPVTAPDLARARCNTEVDTNLLRFDRISGLVIARTSIPKGTQLGTFAPSSAAVGAGAVLTLRSRSGPVAIERQVTTLQPARSGERVFVRDASGTVISVPLVLGKEISR